MKKLKRYQYERYAILCQLAYPDADEQYQKILDPFYERQLVDNLHPKQTQSVKQKILGPLGVCAATGSTYVFQH